MQIATRRLVLSLLLAAPAGGTAQDANYWTYQFGTRSNLLGGAVMGSPSTSMPRFTIPAR